MNKPQNLAQRIAYLGLFVLLLVGLAAIFRSLSRGGLAPAVTAPAETATAEPTSPPATEIVATQTPFEIIIQTETTPIPTSTPRPTTTPRPGPTATPYPTHALAADPSGTILYVPLDQQVVRAVQINDAGQKLGDAFALPLALEFSPCYAAPSPDGRYVLVGRPSEPGCIPYVFDTQSEQLWSLFRENPFTPGLFFGWHPDGRQVLFWGHDIAIWLVNAETGESTTLAVVDGPVQGAAISPDGTQIVYIAYNPPSLRTMWKVSASGVDARPLFDLSTSYVFGWSPDGANILYTGELTSDTGGPMWLMDPEGQNRRPLSGPALFFTPDWSPDGQWVAFTGQEEGRTFGCAQNPPSPDSETCLFEGTAVFVENVVTGEIRRLASGIEPVWSPDGSMLAFISNQSGTQEIWTIRTDGTALQQVTMDGQPKGLRLAWSP